MCILIDKYFDILKNGLSTTLNIRHVNGESSDIRLIPKHQKQATRCFINVVKPHYFVVLQ